MSASFAGEGSGPGGSNLWDSMPLTPPTPPTTPQPEEFLWSKPELLREPDPDDKPKQRAKPAKRSARSGGRPVKKAARKATRSAGTAAGKRKRR